MKWLVSLWRSLKPSERKAIARAWNVLVTVVLGIVSQRVIRAIAPKAAIAAVGAAATLGGMEVAEQPDAYSPMAHANLSAEIPAGTPVGRDPLERAAAIAESQEAAEDTTAGPDDVPEPQTLAAFEQPGCVTKPVRNFSSRAGARPALLVAHYTVSPNRPGWGDVDGIVNYFNNRRAQASSHYVIDFEGHCAYLVRSTAKAWTQGFFNPWSISIEFIATGRERVWPDAALRKGARVFAAEAKRWGIPIRPAVVSGCRVVSAGITDHDALGCGNNHTDVKPHFPMARFMAYVRAAAGPAAVPKPRPPARPYRVCSWRPGWQTARCANAKDPGAAVELRLRRGHTKVGVTRR